MSIHQTGPFVDWIIGTLEAAGITVGDAHAPTSIPAGAGYAVVYPIPGGTTDGTLDDPRSDAAANIQITTSSTNPHQTRWLADKIRTTLNASIPATLTDGRHIYWLDFPEGSPGMNRDDDVQPSRYYIPDRFEIGTTP